MLRPRWLCVALATLALAGLSAGAQEPKPGASWYEDEVDLGFRVKAPKDWSFTPGTPLDVNLIGKYAPNNGEGVGLGAEAAVFVNVWLLRFDRRGRTGDESGAKAGEGDEEHGGAKDIHAWMSGGIEKGAGWTLSKGYPKVLKGPKLPAECFVFEGKSTEAIYGYAGARSASPSYKSKPIQCYAAVFRLQDDLEVALVGIGPGEKKWRSYEKAFEALAKTFEAAQVVSLASGPAGPGPRNEKRARLQQEMARTPGWKVYETENYFVVSNCTDLAFLEELQERIEAIREVFLVDYPPEKARLVASPANEPPNASKEPDGKPADVQDPGRTIALVNPLEASRSSVVRVCANQEQYIQYGGQPGAPGYWNSAAEELVLFDDQAGGGRADTWVVLNHEAFHQYIYYFYGNISPHSWYNEGTGDFYSGYRYERKRFELTENPWRIRTIQEMLRQGVASGDKRDFGYAPLPELVNWTQAQYYNRAPSGNKYGLEGHKVYAQGWSLIWFLRTGAKNKAKGWTPAWGSILERYLETLARTGDLQKAVDEAFEDVDWAALDESWRNYIL